MPKLTNGRVTAPELQTVARRVVNARKCLNQREGWSRREDTLPAALLAETPSGEGSRTLSANRLDTMVAAYYHDAAATATATFR